MTNYEAIEWLKVEASCIIEDGDGKELIEAYDMAINALKQESITWIVGKNNCQVAVRNMPADKMQKICAIIGEVRENEQEEK